MGPSERLKENAARYAAQRGIRLEHQLGFGKDGSVFSTHVPTAVKAHVDPDAYAREILCYMRLTAQSVIDIGGHNVPMLVDWDDQLLIIEMTIVRPPFVLDFASAYLDRPPDFPPEVIEEWREEKAEQFGANWARVEALLDEARARYGIYLLDVHPGNIAFNPPATTEGTES
jgi:hypothetical protein